MPIEGNDESKHEDPLRHCIQTLAAERARTGGGIATRYDIAVSRVPEPLLGAIVLLMYEPRQSAALCSRFSTPVFIPTPSSRSLPARLPMIQSAARPH
jgi:hypothetical protein